MTFSLTKTNINDSLMPPFRWHFLFILRVSECSYEFTHDVTQLIDYYYNTKDNMSQVLSSVHLQLPTIT